MSNPTNVSSRKRSLSNSTVEVTDAIPKNGKKQKVNKEKAVANPEYALDEEIESSWSKSKGRIVERMAVSEEIMSAVASSFTLGADVDKNASNDEDKENLSVDADLTINNNAQPDQEIHKVKPLTQRLHSPPKSIVPIHLLDKKYNTMPPPWKLRQVRIPPDLPNKSYDTTPPSLKSYRSRVLSTAASPSPTQNMMDGRAMVTATKTASVLQKTIPGYPASGDPFPKDFTLTELCMHYPNHLFGDNLHPFLQYDWSPYRIYNLLPAQSGVPDQEKVTANGIASRLRKVKSALEKLGGYAELMNGPRTHAER